MLATAADTIAFGRTVIVHHGCGDCHGGGDNPAAPMWLVGFRAGTEDTLFWPFKVPTPAGVFWTRPRNLTPDNETGLGRFSERQIQRPALWRAPAGRGCRHHGDDAAGNFRRPQVPRADAVAGIPPHVGSRAEVDRGVLKRGLKPQTNKVDQ
jgi:hypothetical protein